MPRSRSLDSPVAKLDVGVVHLDGFKGQLEGAGCGTAHLIHPLAHDVVLAILVGLGFEHCCDAAEASERQPQAVPEAGVVQCGINEGLAPFFVPAALVLVVRVELAEHELVKVQVVLVEAPGRGRG